MQWHALVASAFVAVAAGIAIEIGDASCQGCVMRSALAGTRTCTQEEARAAEEMAATAGSWRRLHQQFARYAHCDDGAIAEGFSESVSLLLVKRWKDIEQLETLARSDPTFRAFVIRHIDETVPVDRLRLIARNARTRCPATAQNLCREIETAATGS